MAVEFTWTVLGSSTLPAAATPATPGAAAGAEALRDKAIDPLTGELRMVDGDQVYTSGVDGIADHLQAILSTWLGECFLDTSKGVDYRGTVLTNFGRESDIRAHFRTKILSCPGIVEVISVTSERDTQLRLLSISFEARADTGDVIARNVKIPFGGE